MRKIPIAKPFLGQEEADAASKTILSGWVTQGPRVQEFEENFAKYVGSKYAVAVSNCTTALHLSLIVLGVGEGDEVIVPSMSYIATANCAKYVNADVVFAEVKDDYNLDIEDVKKKITEKTKAVILVHQVGMPGDISEFKALCDEKGIALVEDAACAIGGEYQGSKIGSHSDLVCFSFHPRKVITTGDGGMIATSNKEYHDRLKLLRQHAMSVNDRVRHESKTVIFEDHLEVGYNYRMTDIQASVGIHQLNRLAFILEERRKIAKYYIEELGKISGVILPIEEEGKYSNYQSFIIRIVEGGVERRNELMNKLLEKGVATRRGIMLSHKETAYRSITDCSLPRSEYLNDHSIIIPLYVGMSEDDQKYVVDSIKEVF